MLFENTGLVGLKSDLAYLDESMEKVGFFRSQWDYNFATYDLKFEDKKNNADYYLRINTRPIDGKLESPHAVLEIEAVYMGKTMRPQGIEYESPIPQHLLTNATQKLEDLKRLLDA